MSQRHDRRPNAVPAHESRIGGGGEPAASSGPDVRQLDGESLPEAAFPGGRDQKFRVFFAPEVHDTLWQHAVADTSVEICGVLVGRWSRDRDGPFVEISGSIPGDSAESKFAEVTFTHQTWAKINEEMDRKYPDLTIVGWYHTHPDFGVFLSDRDVFIQQHFFSSAGHIAHVIDPVRHTEGVFVWEQGKPTLTRYFWVGSDLKTSTAAGQEGVLPATAGLLPSSPSRPLVPPGPWLPTWDRLLSYLALLLLGYLVASVRTAWSETRLTEGVVAHYGIWQGLRPGLGESLDQVSARLRLVSKRVDALAVDHLKHLGKGDDVGAIQEEWQRSQKLLSESGQLLGRIKSTYDLSPTEAVVVRDQIIRRLRELGEPIPSRPSELEKANSNKEGTESSRPSPASSEKVGTEAPSKR